MLQTYTEIPYKIYSMIEVELSAISQKSLSKSCNLDKQQIYFIENIICGTYIVLATEDKSLHKDKRLFDVNNYIDWDQYTSLYDSDFINTGTEGIPVNKVSTALGIPAKTLCVIEKQSKDYSYKSQENQQIDISFVKDAKQVRTF
ncbi:conserved hypothetical protein [Coccidioides posadasii str. Silveira]|uniref:Uncharacterized protein n=1 Tax=Coccidioides posadasii (strain RMSCC 757 / Silveira) TaxID=443226 RepID=E9CUQ4_COCPS|nr:conserved hypothetical protein [Coccidioides posadasii str. Silveira]